MHAGRPRRIGGVEDLALDARERRVRFGVGPGDARQRSHRTRRCRRLTTSRTTRANVRAGASVPPRLLSVSRLHDQRALHVVMAVAAEHGAENRKIAGLAGGELDHDGFAPRGISFVDFELLDLEPVRGRPPDRTESRHAARLRSLRSSPVRTRTVSRRRRSTVAPGPVRDGEPPGRAGRDEQRGRRGRGVSVSVCECMSR